MTNTRQKLIELLKQTPIAKINGHIAEAEVCFVSHVFESFADHLIAHGVTVQEWIPVTERLPENDYGKHWKERQHYLVCLANGLMRVATFGYKEYGWWIDSHNCVLSKEHYTEVTHWMPLPEPPKEDNPLELFNKVAKIVNEIMPMDDLKIEWVKQGEE